MAAGGAAGCGGGRLPDMPRPGRGGRNGADGGAASAHPRARGAAGTIKFVQRKKKKERDREREEKKKPRPPARPRPGACSSFIDKRTARHACAARGGAGLPSGRGGGVPCPASPQRRGACAPRLPRGCRAAPQGGHPRGAAEPRRAAVPGGSAAGSGSCDRAARGLWARRLPPPPPVKATRGQPSSCCERGGIPP